MARTTLMSWEGDPCYRWVKMYRGRRYRISCHDLGVPRSQWTKEGSYQAANLWWRAKEQAIDGRCEQERPHADAIAELQKKEAIAAALGFEEEREQLKKEMARIAGLDAADSPGLSPETLQLINDARMFGIHVDSDADPDLLEKIFGRDRIWSDRQRRMQTLPADRTIKAASAAYLKQKRDEVENNLRSPDGYDNIRRTVERFVDFCGESNSAECISADLWHRWYVHCAAKVAAKEAGGEGWSVIYARDEFQSSRAFVRWLWERDWIPSIPRNLNSKQFSFEIEESEIPTFNNSEIQDLLKNSHGQLKLHLLLMLNCGFTQKDLSDLRHDQIDLKAGTISRKRSKTKNKKSVPKVTYRLWPVTVRELRKWRSSDPTFALRTNNGLAWVRKAIRADGKLGKVDYIAVLFRRLKAKIGMTEGRKSLKVFRKTASTRIGGNRTYRPLRHLFLGHSSRNVADRYYVETPNELLREAIEWLGCDLGIVKAKSRSTS
jgi:integrase